MCDYRGYFASIFGQKFAFLTRTHIIVKIGICLKSRLRYKTHTPLYSLYNKKKKLSFHLKNDDNKDLDTNGISGILSLSLPNEKGKDEKELYIQGKLGPQVISEICRNQNYAHGQLIGGSNPKAEKVPTFHVKPDFGNKSDQKFCMNMFGQIVAGQYLDAEEITQIQDRCIRESKKNHVQIKCTKPFEITSSLAAQNACGSGESCPTGFREAFKNVPT